MDHIIQQRQPQQHNNSKSIDLAPVFSPFSSSPITVVERMTPTRRHLSVATVPATATSRGGDHGSGSSGSGLANVRSRSLTESRSHSVRNSRNRKRHGDRGNSAGDSSSGSSGGCSNVNTRKSKSSHTSITARAIATTAASTTRQSSHSSSPARRRIQDDEDRLQRIRDLVATASRSPKRSPRQQLRKRHHHQQQQQQQQQEKQHNDDNKDPLHHADHHHHHHQTISPHSSHSTRSSSRKQRQSNMQSLRQRLAAFATSVPQQKQKQQHQHQHQHRGRSPSSIHATSSHDSQHREDHAPKIPSRSSSPASLESRRRNRLSTSDYSRQQSMGPRRSTSRGNSGRFGARRESSSSSMMGGLDSDNTSLAYSETSRQYTDTSSIVFARTESSRSRSTTGYVSSASETSYDKKISSFEDDDDGGDDALMIIHPSLLPHQTSSHGLSNETPRVSNRSQKPSQQSRGDGHKSSSSSRVVQSHSPYKGVMMEMVDQMHGSGTSLDFREAFEVSRHSKERAIERSSHSRRRRASSLSNHKKRQNSKLNPSSTGWSSASSLHSHQTARSFAQESLHSQQTATSFAQESVASSSVSGEQRMMHSSSRGRDAEHNSKRHPRYPSPGPTSSSHVTKAPRRSLSPTETISRSSSKRSHSHSSHSTNRSKRSLSSSPGKSSTVSDFRSQERSQHRNASRNEMPQRSGESSSIDCPNAFHGSAPEIVGDQQSPILNSPRVSVSSMLLAKDLSVSKRLAYIDASVRSRPPLPPASVRSPNLSTRSPGRSTLRKQADRTRTPSPDEKTERVANRTSAFPEEFDDKPKLRTRSHSPRIGCTSRYGHYSPIRKRPVLGRSRSTSSTSSSSHSSTSSSSHSSSSSSSLDLEEMRRRYEQDKKKKEKEQFSDSTMDPDYYPRSPADVTAMIEELNNKKNVSNHGDSTGEQSTSSHESYSLEPIKLDIPNSYHRDKDENTDKRQDEEESVSADITKPASNLSMSMSQSDSSLPSLSSIETYETATSRFSAGPKNEGGSNAQHHRSLDVSALEEEKDERDEHQPRSSFLYRDHRGGDQIFTTPREEGSYIDKAFSKIFSEAIPPPPFDMSSPSIGGLMHHSFSHSAHGGGDDDERRLLHHAAVVTLTPPTDALWKKIGDEKTRQQQLRKRLQTIKAQS